MTLPRKNYHWGRRILVAFLSGTVLGLLVFWYIDQSAPLDSAALTPVVVAARDIHAGSVLRPEVLKVILLPTDVVPPQSVPAPEQLSGRRTTVPLVRGEPILLPKLQPEGTPPAGPLGRRVAALGGHFLSCSSDLNNLWQRMRLELARRQIW